jgi:hypothetical protein
MHDAARDQEAGTPRGGELDLPVFTVSASDCQKLERRRSRDGQPHTFTHLRDTGVCALRGRATASCSSCCWTLPIAFGGAA